MSGEEERLTAEEAARRLRMTETEVRRHVREGRLPALRIEDGLLIRAGDLEKLLTLIQGEEALSEE